MNKKSKKPGSCPNDPWIALSHLSDLTTVRNRTLGKENISALGILNLLFYITNSKLFWVPHPFLNHVKS